MAQSVLIIAESGAGKSHAVQYLDHEKTFIVNVANKPLPFKGWKTKYPKLGEDNPKGRLSSVSSPKGIMQAMEYVDKKRPEIKNLVVDDWQYMSAFEFFDRADEKGYEKFTDIGKWLAQTAKMPAGMRDDLTVFFLTHSEETQDSKGIRKQKAKTIGKMVDEKLTLEGLFSVVLYARIKKDKDGNLQYVFETKNNGTNTCKAPLGMFETDDIENNLQLVKDSIIKYEQ